MRRLRSALLCACLAFYASESAGGQQRDTTITIDASKLPSSAASYRRARRDRVTVQVVNINPFVHQYRLTGKQTVYTESAIADFSKSVLGITVAIPSAPSSSNVGMMAEGFKGSKAAPKDATAMCADGTAAQQQMAEAAAKLIESEMVTLLGEGNSFAAAAKVLADSSTAFDRRAAPRRALLRRTDVSGSVLKDSALAQAKDLSGHVQTLRAGKSAVEDIDGKFVARLSGLTKLVGEFASAYPTCQYFLVRKSDALQWAADSVAYRAFLTRVAERITALSSETATLERATDDGLFSFARVFGDVDEVEVIDLLIERKFVGDSLYRVVAQPRLLFGERRRFAIATGALISALAVDQFSVVAGYKGTTGPAADTIESRVVRTSSSARTVAPALALTARLLSWNGVVDGLHLLTAGAPQTDGARTANFFGGIGLSALDERLMVGAGFTNGVTQKAAPGFGEGTRVPAALANVPTESGRATVFGVLVGFRVY